MATRVAASSMARGSPSSLRQISTTVAALDSSTAKLVLTLLAALGEEPYRVRLDRSGQHRCSFGDTQRLQKEP